jgi:hypothetical protein
MIDMYSSEEGIISSTLRDLERLEGTLNTLEQLELETTRKIHESWVELLNIREFIIYFSTLQ